MSRNRSIRLIAGLASAAAIVVLPATPYAFAKGKPPPAAATKTCSVSPTAVTVGSDYSLVAAGLPANTAVSVYVVDPVGTQWTNGMTDSSGALSVSEHASYSGAYSAKVTTGAVSGTALATCSFSVS